MNHCHIPIRLTNIKTYLEIAGVDDDIIWNPVSLLFKYKKIQELCKTVWKFFKKLKIELSYNACIYMHIHKYVLTHTLMDKNTKGFESWSGSDITSVFNARLFFVVKNCSESKWPSRDEQVTNWDTQNGIVFNCKKWRKFCHLWQF